MSLLKRGQLKCSTNSKNTGFGTCFLDWKQIAGGFIYDRPRTFTEDEVAHLQETLLLDAANDSKALRAYPIHNFVAPTDNSEKVIIETFDYGSKAIVRDGDIDWTFQYVKGGQCVQKALRTHNGASFFLLYDKENKILGWNKSTGFSTIPSQFVYAHPFTLATGAKTAGYMLEFVFLAKYANEESDFIKADFDFSEIEGLEDVIIKLNSWNQDTGVANVTLQIDCGGDNFYDLFNGQLTGASFTAADEDGNTVAVDTFTPNPNNKTFDIGLLVGDLPDSGTVTIMGALLSVLKTQNIEGFEIGSLDLPIVGS